jgi:hypothetical protein
MMQAWGSQGLYECKTGVGIHGFLLRAIKCKAGMPCFQGVCECKAGLGVLGGFPGEFSKGNSRQLEGECSTWEMCLLYGATGSVASALFPLDVARRVSQSCRVCARVS